MKKVVLLGGSGYLGRNIVRALLHKHGLVKSPAWSLLITSRNPTPAAEQAFRRAIVEEHAALKDTPLLEKSLLPFARVDITDHDQVANVCKDADVVVNLVGIMDEQPPNWTFEKVQHEGARNVAEAVAKQADTRLIHVSALGSDPESNVPYARTKGLGEEAIRKVFRSQPGASFGVSPKAIILRPGLVIGREDQFLNRFAMLTKYLPVFPVFGGGHSPYQPIYVNDLAHIIVNAIECAFPPGKAAPVLTLEVGGPKVYTFRELIQMTTRKAKLPADSWLQYVIPPLLIPVPFSVAMLQAWVMEKTLPVGSPLRISRDQVTLLQRGNVVEGSSFGLENAKKFQVMDELAGKPEENVSAQEQAVVDALFHGLPEVLHSVEDVYGGGHQWMQSRWERGKDIGWGFQHIPEEKKN